MREIIVKIRASLPKRALQIGTGTNALFWSEIALSVGVKN